MDNLKSLDFIIRNFKVSILCVFGLFWTVVSFKLSEYIGIKHKNIVNSALAQLIIIGICLLILWLCKKVDTPENVLREKSKSLQRAFNFGAYFQKEEHKDWLIDGLIENFKKDFRKGGFYWALYMIWRDNFVSVKNIVRNKILN